MQKIQENISTKMKLLCYKYIVKANNTNLKIQKYYILILILLILSFSFKTPIT